MSQPKLPLALALAILATPLAGAERAPSAWSLIEAVRASLAADGRLQADFTQTYTPAGFSAGETESGRLALALPDCLRWDYTGAEAKSFLLCGRDAYSWNAGDPEGRHQRVESRDEPGLDLLLLPLDHLRQRYDAAVSTGPEGPTITLTPRADAGGKSGGKGVGRSPLGAQLELDAAGKRLRSLSYTDRDNNATRFAITGYRLLADGTLFTPPALQWRED
jgi:hypothetical protein